MFDEAPVFAYSDDLHLLAGFRVLSRFWVRGDRGFVQRLLGWEDDRDGNCGKLRSHVLDELVQMFRRRGRNAFRLWRANIEHKWCLIEFPPDVPSHLADRLSY